ncbi:MAG: sulfatase-like hydrolase/transferase [Erysipelotrichaceae bacterium]|nr:sulfatase-like hydrolase/transferase [Erysipelotrichaceae bacterium]
MGKSFKKKNIKTIKLQVEPVIEKKIENEKEKRMPNALKVIGYFSLSFFYLECILKASTMNTSWDISLVYILLYAIALSCLIYFISSLTKKEIVNRRIRTIVLVTITVIFIANYFIYYVFKIFYDVNTVTAGGGDALGGFIGMIFEIVFCFNGLLHILLFSLPSIIYFKTRLKWDDGKKDNKLHLVLIAVSCVISYCGQICCINMNDKYKRLYSTEYNYQSSVASFGLMHSIILDAEKNIFNKADVSFSNEEEIVETPVTEEIKHYDKNIMDIDFETLEEHASDAYIQLDQYVQSQSASLQNEYTGLFKGKNLIMLSAEAFSAEVIDENRTPTLYRLATKGINFTDYYQPASAGTTGGEYENIFGMLPMLGGSSLKSTYDNNNYLTIGSQLNRLHYNGWAFHNNDYTYYDRNKTHNNLGYSHGFMGYGNGMEQYVQKEWPQSDLEMMEGTVPMYIDKQPFNVYYMTVSGHNGYSKNANAMTKKNWDRVADLPYSDEVKGYLAANMELEDALTYLVNALEEKGIADDTVIVLGADHFPYGLDYNASLGNMPYLSELYGYNVTNYLERDHNRLIIWSGCLEDNDPIIVDDPVSSLDILPTLCNLFGVEYDSRLLPGRDVLSSTTPLVFNINYDWKTDKGTYLAWSDTFIPEDSTTVVTDAYIKKMKNIVSNKIKYCEAVLKLDYFDYLFGKKGDSE